MLGPDGSPSTAWPNSRCTTARGDFASAIDKMMGILLSPERGNERTSWRFLRALRYRFGHNTEKPARAELGQLFLALVETPLLRCRLMVRWSRSLARR